MLCLGISKRYFFNFSLYCLIAFHITVFSSQMTCQKENLLFGKQQPDSKKIHIVACSANVSYSCVSLSRSSFAPISSAPWSAYSKTQCQLFWCYADETNPQLSCFQTKRKGRFLFWARYFSTMLSQFPSQQKSATGAGHQCLSVVLTLSLSSQGRLWAAQL